MGFYVVGTSAEANKKLRGAICTRDSDPILAAFAQRHGHNYRKSVVREALEYCRGHQVPDGRTRRSTLLHKHTELTRA